MKTNLLLLVTSILIAFVNYGCKDNEDANVKYQEGILINYGDPALDGCGWKLKIGEDLYKPVELDKQFCKDSLKVYVDFTIISPTSNCAWNTINHPTIEISHIKLR